MSSRSIRYELFDSLYGSVFANFNFNSNNNLKVKKMKDDFQTFKAAINKNLAEMSKKTMFLTNLAPDDAWKLYLKSFPKYLDPIYKEATVHNCNCCKSFIRRAASVVTIEGGKLRSIWDIDIGGGYQKVADALAKKVKSSGLKTLFLNDEEDLGTDHNFKYIEGENPIRFDHFHFKLPAKHVNESGRDSVRGVFNTAVQTLTRAVTTITPAACQTVIDLTMQGSLYRGEQSVKMIQDFAKFIKEYEDSDDKEIAVFSKVADRAKFSAIRNSSIGTLLVDLSEGVDLEQAVRSYELKVAPENYQRPKALVTPAMVEKAKADVEKLGFEASLYRRHAVLDDISINEVLFADRAVKKSKGVFDDLADSLPDKIGKMKDRVEEISIDKFLKDVLPSATELEIYFDGQNQNHLVSLIAPENKDAPVMFSHHNNFSWTYYADVADSMKETVKKFGGNIKADLRFSIMWNEEGSNNSDYDAHALEPNGNLISYPKKSKRQPSSGMLDVDIVSPGGKVAVENITWINKCIMPVGVYELKVHGYSCKPNEDCGFKAEVEFDGHIYKYDYAHPVGHKKYVNVANVTIDGDGNFSIEHKIDSSESSREVWGITTNKFHKVSVLMRSPNHWGSSSVGHKHYFFMLEGCNNPDPARGFYNEFLSHDLQKHRKVFELLGSKMRVEPSDSQLSGLGFSKARKDSVLCRVTGSFNRVVKINF